MEEDVGAKAPVTRLRRRLSVEQSEEVKSPSAPSTPTKKRGGRLAAKPQLELIDENSSENAPKRQTKKTATKDVIEAIEEKVLTPSRRSTRIKSNTSIVSDTPQGFDSPRAKRAARRTSLIGSDNEAPLTPVRQTRRTRKDSTSSIDKQENNTSSVKKSAIIADSIIEEVEANSQKSLENEKSEITPKRKSPRLQKKNKHGDIDTENEDVQQKNNHTTDTNKTSKNKISDDSFQLINRLDDRPINKTQFNNTASSVNSKKTRRKRTNTWTAAQNDNSDVKKQNNLEVEEKADDNVINFGQNKDKQDTSSNKINDEIQEENKDLFNTSKSKQKRNNISSNNSELDQLDKSSTEKMHLIKTNDTINSESAVLNETEKLFEKPPVTAVQSLIYFDDSDSDSRGKPASDKPGDSEDQCVPVVPEINNKSVHVTILNQNENASDKVSYNDTCEPMDIDETMPTNVSLLNSSNSNQDKDAHEMLEKSKEQKISGENIKSPNKSKRDSTSTLSTSQNNDKTGNENKSTLILSQLKDVSTTDNSLTKSPKPTQLKDISTNDNSLTKSPKAVVEESVTNIDKDGDTDKKDSLTYMTSTPLQQKNLNKIAIQINTSVISNSNNGSIQHSPAKKNKKNVSKQSNISTEVSSTEESDSGGVSTKDKSDFLDDEAEEASIDYESGDSQDEEERQYAEENEILEKGETLDSDDDGSSDTDYEKDSFVVSSDEEDNELLNGSGDDLSMSDNELTMSKKSKKKFNERKSKEQKKASREMYEARHNIITKHKKNKRQRLNSSTLQSEEEIEVKSKNNKRMKIDSSQDSNTGNEEEGDPKETNSNVSMAKEHEITSVCDESVVNKNDPLSINVKSEPKTPLKDLDMSTVPILDKIEEVQIDQNVTIMKSNETSDPLQDDSDASSISENMEISSNYDSVLKELNKEVENRKIKSSDISLNLNKKTKQTANDPIVDTLNLTNTKKSKRIVNKNNTSIHTNTSQKLNSSSSDTKNKGEFDESSSDSIDLQLLFSEDSSDSIKKVSESKQDEQNKPERFIPLKRTEAKTNIPEENTEESFKNQSQVAFTSTKKHKKKNSLSMSEDIHNITANPEVSLNSLFDTSSKKKKNSISNDGIDLIVSQKVSIENISINTTLNSRSKKKKSSISAGDETSNAKNASNENNQKFSLDDIDPSQSINSSIKKKKKKNSISVGYETSNAEDASNENDQKISLDNIDPNQSINTSIKKKKKKNSISVGDETSDSKDASNENDQKISLHQIDPNQSINSSTKKKKKKNSISVSDETSDAKDASNENDQNISQIENEPNLSINTSNKMKKKKKSISSTFETESATNVNDAVNQGEQTVSQMDHNISLNNTLSTSSKKKKKNSISVSEDMEDKNNISVTNKVSDISFNKSRLDQSTNSALNTSSKKKNKNSVNSEVDSESKVIEVNTAQSDSNVLDKSLNELTVSATKKNKQNDSVVANLNLTSTSFNVKVNDSLTSSAKKKKNKKADLQDIRKESQDGESDAPEEIPYTSHKSYTADDTLDGVHIFIDTEGNQDWNTLITSGSSKKKNKKNKEVQETPSVVDEVVETDKEGTGKSKKRKRKSSANSTSQEAASEDLDQKLLSDSVHVENKRKKLKTSQLADDISTDIKDTNKKQNKKRKERDDDDPIVTSKVFKQNSSGKLCVPRLPSTILNQLEDKPKKEILLSVPRLPSTILNQLEDKPKKEILRKKEAKVVSTTQFIVEEAQKRKNKPSNYLEESVYLNDSVVEQKQKGFIKIPKVLPFVPTATISGSGFTTKFQINVLAKETKFVAQTSNMAGFKNEYLSSKKIKKAGTYLMYKSQRNRKISKF